MNEQPEDSCEQLAVSSLQSLQSNPIKNRQVHAAAGSLGSQIHKNDRPSSIVNGQSSIESVCMSSTTSFGTWLRQWRRNRNLTQVELAELAGCAVGTLRNIEADDARPSKQLAARLARALGVAEGEINAVVAFARGTSSTFEAATSATVPTSQTPSRQIAPLNLPAQMTGLIGRINEVQAVRALLKRTDVRLVTLTGPGGTGKTRVAIQVASQLREAFSDGLAFVDLSAISDAPMVLPTIAQTLGVKEDGSQPLGTRLAEALRDQSLLLLLDNFEQVIDAALQVATLLASCPRLKVLVTSRIALGLAGEYEWPVPPLPLPDRMQLPALEQLSQYESVRLFSERARAANPHFAVTTSNAPAVAEICHQLDGLPLAIELAAARVKLFQPQALLARLDHRLSFLTGGRDRPSRQQTMRNTIDWSYQLLMPDEQTLFRRFGIFVGGATLQAIEAVCGDDAATPQLHDVAALVNHSLLRALSVQQADNDDPRFGMLETIREYAQEQLAAHPDAAVTRQKYARYYSAMAETAAAQWEGPTADRIGAQLQRDYDNIRAVLQWALESDSILGLRLATALRVFWQSRGYYSEGRAWLQQLLALEQRTDDREAITARLNATHTAAWLASDQHDYASATQLFEQSVALARVLGESENEIHLFGPAAREARALGDYARAIALLEDRLAHYRAAGDQRGFSAGGIGLALYELGLALREQGDFARTTALFEESIAFHRALGDNEGVAVGLLGLSDIARDQGDAARLRDYCTTSLEMLRRLDMQWGIGFALNNMALAAYLEGDLASATQFVTQSLDLFRRLQGDASRAEILITQGMILLAQGNAAAAYAAFSESLRIALALGPRLLVAYALEGLANVAISGSDADLAVRLLVAAAKFRAQMGTPERPIDTAVLDRTRATARSLLNDNGFAAAWAAADGLSIDELLRTIPARYDA